VVSHLATFVDSQGPLGDAAWLLHMGIFVVWLPTVLVANRLTTGASPKDLWKAALRGCPPWMQQAIKILTGYAVVNFVIFVLRAPKQGGHGPMSPVVVRGFSGHWMVFYGVAFGVLYSALRLPSWQAFRLCPSGHRCNFAAKFCDQCGTLLPEAPTR
jgi:hypothetical protein